MDNTLSVQGMREYLSSKVDPAQIHVYATLESTNTTAKELSASEAAHGTVIIADGQTAGRGRYGRSFFSPPGHGIYISVILLPERLTWEGSATLITLRAAVSVCEVIEAATGKTPLIKWVNDVFLEGKKICGILTEAVTDSESGQVTRLIIGVGINFSTPESQFPEVIRQTAGSIFMRDEPTVSRNRLAAEVVNKLMEAGEQPDEALIDNYKRRLFILGSRVTVMGAAETYEATAVDVDDAGHLLVKTDDGEIRSLSSGEVRISM